MTLDTISDYLSARDHRLVTIAVRHLLELPQGKDKDYDLLSDRDWDRLNNLLEALEKD